MDFAVVLAPCFLVFFCTVATAVKGLQMEIHFLSWVPFYTFLFASSLGFVFHAFLGRLHQSSSLCPFFKFIEFLLLYYLGGDF